MIGLTETPAALKPPWSFVFLLAAMTALGPLSIDMCLPSLVDIEHEFGSAPGSGTDIISIYFAGLAFGQLLYGPASDRFGRRGPLLVGLALYAAASVACALATSGHALLAARLAQSLGGCASMVIARAVVRDHFDHHESARMFSLLALITGVAPILAPLCGGLLLRFIGWRAIFVLLALLGAAVGATVLIRLKESRSAAVAQRARSEHPLRAFGALFAKRRLVGYLLAGALNSACIFTYIATSSSVLIGVYKMSPVQFGLIFGVNSLGLITASSCNRALLRHFTPDQILRGAAAAAVGFAVMLAGVVGAGAGGLIALLIPLFCTIASSSLVQANALAGALAVDSTRVGSAAALFGGGGFGVGALAASLAGALHDGTAKPMVFVIAGCLLGCAAALYGLALPRAARQSA